jgi:hypothetical protein
VGYGQLVKFPKKGVCLGVESIFGQKHASIFESLKTFGGFCLLENSKVIKGLAAILSLLLAALAEHYARPQWSAVSGRAAGVSEKCAGGVMRQPLEDGAVTISRAAVSVTFPARFMLAAAMNPCPCGYFGDPTRECHCTPPIIHRYVSKISGPLLDRIDIHIRVPAVKYKELRAPTPVEGSEAVRLRLIAARDRQLERSGKVSRREENVFERADDAEDDSQTL